MLLKTATLALHTAVLILSIRPPPSAKTTSRATDKITDEGPFSFFMIKLMPELGQVAAVLGSAFYCAFMYTGWIPSDLKLWQAAATTLAVLGYLLRKWAFRTLDRFFTYALTIRPNHKLVQDGPYKYLLHPSYTGLMMTGMSYIAFLVYQGYWDVIARPILNALPVHIPMPGELATLGFLLGCVGLTIYRVRGEEKMLKDHFQSEFTAYASKRWRFIPFVV
ncbi:hypothetical protein BGZ73_002478 [Actinomortierella ambigua]|nr:hypothetical protein BGZ73_002478 [Actinomortierella ambigua]